MKKTIIFLLMFAVLISTAFSAKWFSLEATDEWGDKTGKKYLACLSDQAVYSNRIISNDDLYYCSIVYDPDEALDSNFKSYIMVRAYKYSKGPGYSDFVNDVRSIDIQVQYADTTTTIKCYIMTDYGIIYPADDTAESQLVQLAKRTHSDGGRLRIKGSLADCNWSFRAQFNF